MWNRIRKNDCKIKDEQAIFDSLLIFYLLSRMQIHYIEEAGGANKVIPRDLAGIVDNHILLVGQRNINHIPHVVVIQISKQFV